MVHNRAVRQSSFESSDVEYVILFHWSASVKCTVLQGTQWTLWSSSFLRVTTAQWNKPAFSSCIQPTARWFIFKPVFKYSARLLSEPVATTYEPRHQDSASRQTGQGTNSPVFWHSASSLQRNHCGTVSKSFFLLVRLGIIFYLTKTMWGSIYCVSNRMGGPWMEGPTDEQRIMAISGCDSI